MEVSSEFFDFSRVWVDFWGSTTIWLIFVQNWVLQKHCHGRSWKSFTNGSLLKSWWIKHFPLWIFGFFSENRPQTDLVGGFNPFAKYSSKWIISPNRDENNTSLSCHHPEISINFFVLSSICPTLHDLGLCFDGGTTGDAWRGGWWTTKMNRIKRHWTKN